LAQTTCAFGHPRMANVWMHNGFLQVEGRKMAKSEGNFVTIEELLREGWDGRVLRFAMLKTHYRQPIDWTRNGLLQAAMDLHGLVSSVPVERPREEALLGENPIVNALLDDLNTP